MDGRSFKLITEKKEMKCEVVIRGNFLPFFSLVDELNLKDIWMRKKVKFMICLLLEIFLMIKNDLFEEILEIYVMFVCPEV